jgi:hypothetical protein
MLPCRELLCDLTAKKRGIVSCKRRRSPLIHHLFTILITVFNLELRQGEREEHMLALHSFVIPAAAKG